VKNLGVDIEQTRQEILRELDPNFRPAASLVTVPQKTESRKPHPDAVDPSKRYDVYCLEGNREVVYRNAVFKGAKKLFQKSEYAVNCEFLELEQEDGQTVFLARQAVVKFCEHQAGS